MHLGIPRVPQPKISEYLRCKQVHDRPSCKLPIQVPPRSPVCRYEGPGGKINSLGPCRGVRGVRTIATISKAGSSKAEAEGSHAENITMSVAWRTCHAPPRTMPTMCVTPHTHHTIWNKKPLGSSHPRTTCMIHLPKICTSGILLYNILNKVVLSRLKTNQPKQNHPSLQILI